MTSIDDAKNCPFCGAGKDFLSVVGVLGDKECWRTVFCSFCMSDGPHADTDELAIKMWNRRVE